MYKQYKQLRFGTAGIPIGCDGKTADGIAHLRELSLDCMELAFVRSVNIRPEKAPAIKEIAEKNDIALTCHGSYFINLAATESEKIEASKQRILQAARVLDLCGGRGVVFHAGYYMKREPANVYPIIKKHLADVAARVVDEGLNILLRPETTGKATQFGSFKELIQLSSEIEGVLPCIDFAHVHARTVGKYNSYDEFSEILSMIENVLGKEALRNMHIHMTGIAYGDKGEKHHLVLKESDFNYVPLMQAFKDFNIAGVVVSESPNLEDDARLMQKTYRELQ